VDPGEFEFEIDAGYKVEFEVEGAESFG